MKLVKAHQTSDGKLFIDQAAALDHEAAVRNEADFSSLHAWLWSASYCMSHVECGKMAQDLLLKPRAYHSKLAEILARYEETVA